jgi:hypothetical protein
MLVIMIVIGSMVVMKAMFVVVAMRVCHAEGRMK